MKTPSALFTLAACTLTLAGCYSSPTTLPPGQYEHSTSSVDSEGTLRQQNTKTDVYYDDDGRKKMTVNKKTKTDPEGLFNQSTTESSRTVR